jgi:hypothetical protein
MVEGAAFKLCGSALGHKFFKIASLRSKWSRFLRGSRTNDLLLIQLNRPSEPLKWGKARIQPVAEALLDRRRPMKTAAISLGKPNLEGVAA